MVKAYIPRAGDIIWLDFDPQVGREQAKRRPALVITDRSYNQASGIVICCSFDQPAPSLSLRFACDR